MEKIFHTECYNVLERTIRTIKGQGDPYRYACVQMENVDDFTAINVNVSVKDFTNAFNVKEEDKNRTNTGKGRSDLCVWMKGVDDYSPIIIEVKARNCYSVPIKEYIISALSQLTRYVEEGKEHGIYKGIAHNRTMVLYIDEFERDHFEVKLITKWRNTHSWEEPVTLYKDGDDDNPRKHDRRRSRSPNAESSSKSRKKIRSSEGGHSVLSNNNSSSSSLSSSPSSNNNAKRQ